MAKKKRDVHLMSPEQSSKAADRIKYAIENFNGSFEELESAIGMYMLGHYVGWRVLVLLHSKRTIRKYEEILGITVRDEFADEGPEADRSLAYGVAKKVSNFWKVVSGETKLDVAKEERKHFGP
ncbi:hypothetical protein JI739_24030 [Ramlibacter sp. AW1]|uniref:Uncharacterized protein n=1 Tax=Ramlibacter aurantiacus TaxID=2801330 RepID=A0A937D667_9BURK|nr:hypothetical protein [Ramlibacter aurantiacus]MBL0423425.1 hypothetical protein [Ramlibacter aurantiacus]